MHRLTEGKEMNCPICDSEVKRERWYSVKNWETATCPKCGFKFDYDADQLNDETIRIMANKPLREAIRKAREKGSRSQPYEAKNT